MMAVHLLPPLSPKALGEGDPQDPDIVCTIPHPQPSPPPAPGHFAHRIYTPACIYGVVSPSLLIAESIDGGMPREGAVSELDLLLVSQPQSSIEPSVYRICLLVHHTTTMVC